jgi:protoporphyrinogen oxidase
MILGAGFAGLAAADVLRERRIPYLLAEKETAPGGLARTDDVGDFRFDRAGHFLHCSPGRFERALRGSGVEMVDVQRRAAVSIDDQLVPYPLQYNLWAAPAWLRRAVAKELTEISAADPGCDDFATLTEQSWGPTLAATFFFPYARKLWACDPQELPASWSARFLPRRDLALLAAGLTSQVEGFGYNAKFQYPRSGRLGDLGDALAAIHRASLRCSSAIVAVDLQRRAVTFEDGSTRPFSQLINTIPLNVFVRLAGLPWPSCGLRHANVANLRVGFEGEVLRDLHWIYEPSTVRKYFRVGFPSNVSAACCPPGHASLSLEIGLGESTTPYFDAAAIAREAVDDLEQRGIIRCAAIRVVDLHVIAPAYVADRLGSSPELQQLEAGLAQDGIHLAGRFGGWDYLSLEDAFHSGARAAGRASDAFALQHATGSSGTRSDACALP